MEVILLGTGAADGIPNPFCRCGTCTEARLNKQFRTPTSALIDNRLWIDPGPEAPRQISRLGRNLFGLRTILIGHAHDDHLDSAILLHRSWVTQTPLTIAGPAPAIAVVKPWLDPGQTDVELLTLTAGDVLTLDGYRVTALAANHHAYGEALLYLISDATKTVLYATDTGPLPAQTRAALATVRVDLLLLEETFGWLPDKGSQHHHLASFAETVAGLRRQGTIDEQTQIVAIHLGHDNPPLAELSEALTQCGAVALPDGAKIQL